MRIYIVSIVRKFTRMGKEVMSMNQNSEPIWPYRLRDLIWMACDWALRKLPGAIIWMVVRHLVRIKTGYFVNL